MFSGLQDITGQIDIKQTSPLVACLYCMLTNGVAGAICAVAFCSHEHVQHLFMNGLQGWTEELMGHGLVFVVCQSVIHQTLSQSRSDRNCSHKSGSVTWTFALCAAAFSDSDDIT